METNLAAKTISFLSFATELCLDFWGRLKEGIPPRMLPPVLLFLIVLLFLFILRSTRKVAIWNIGWDGKEKALGKLYVRKINGINTISMPRNFIERSDTTAFRIRPCAFFNKAYMGKELVICWGKGEKRFERTQGLGARYQERKPRQILLYFTGSMKFYINI
ncbi:MAG: hypothetical protein IJU50_09855 [Lachnospiraceae bacterium]|nr:hypothetical protein [Lachnospiraceae bacterium]